MTEQQPYQVLQREKGFELRHYPEHVVAEVTINSSFENAGNTAFSALFGYISGQNRSQRKVAMTAPVVQGPVSSQKVAMTAPVVQQPTDDGSYTVAFVLPAAMTEQTAPVPTNPQVRVRTIPAADAAAITFSGRWSRESYERHLTQLHEAMSAAGLRPVGAARYARFDPPFKPWFLRRNEVVQDVVPASA